MGLKYYSILVFMHLLINMAEISFLSGKQPFASGLLILSEYSVYIRPAFGSNKVSVRSFAAKVYILLCNILCEEKADFEKLRGKDY